MEKMYCCFCNEEAMDEELLGGIDTSLGVLFIHPLCMLTAHDEFSARNKDKEKTRVKAHSGPGKDQYQVDIVTGEKLSSGIFKNPPSYGNPLGQYGTVPLPVPVNESRTERPQEKAMRTIENMASLNCTLTEKICDLTDSLLKKEEQMLRAWGDEYRSKVERNLLGILEEDKMPG